MTMTVHASPASDRRLRSFLRRIPLRKTGSLIARWYDRHLQRLALAELDNHQLADIGKSPEEARHECAKPFWRK
jgi:uncharacterized protein YjiS (DUF1127 family)